MKNIKNLVFDLDNTLYSQSLGYQELADAKMYRFLEEKMGMSFEEYKKECQNWRKKCGSTFGLYKEKGTSFDEYLQYVCEHNMDKVAYNDELYQKLKSLPHKKIIYTDANLKHVQNTLPRLKLDDVITDIFTVADGGYIWKGYDGGFERFVKFYNLNPEESVIFEDNLNNLRKAKSLGFVTVLINEEGIEKPDFCDYSFSNINFALNLFS